MDEITIGVAAEDEVEWAAQLMCSSQPWVRLGINLVDCRKACGDRAYRLHIAKRNQKPLGFILSIANGVAGSPYVKSICVAEDARSAGIGEKLMKFSEDMFRPTYRHLFLCVSGFNTRAQSFYKRLGYGQAGKLKDYIVAGEDELLMHKALK